MFHKKLTYRLVILAVFLIIIYFFQSCTLKQTLNINKEAFCDFSFDLVLAPFFIEVAEELAELFPEESVSPDSSQDIFDIDKIRGYFSKSMGSVLKRLENTSMNTPLMESSGSWPTEVFVMKMILI